MQTQSLSFMFQGTQGELEAKLYVPEQLPAHQIQNAVLILHPHPLYGGSMNNKVVTTLVKACCESSDAAFTFNFPGVGKSEGVFQNGIGETQDALRAVHVLQERFPNASISIAGFSFGAYVAYLLAFLFEFKRVILIAPPATHFEMNKTNVKLPPCLVVQGEVDEVIEAEAVYQWVNEYAPSARLVRFLETSHFFHGKLNELKQTVMEFLRESE